MDDIKRFEINLNRFVYYPGQTIGGHVLLELCQNIRIRNIRVNLKCKAHVKLEEIKRGEKRYLKQDQYFLDDTDIIFGRESILSPLQTPISNGKPLSILIKGIHKIPFKFTLPDNYLPCSFESKYGHIRYFLKVILDIPYASPPQEIKYFTIIGPPLENDEKHYQPLVLQKSKNLWFMCGLRKGTLYLDVNLDRMAYCCGEILKFKTKIINKSFQNIFLVIQLIQKVNYNCNGYFKSVSYVVTNNISPKISNNANVQITSSSFRILVPVVPPTLEHICRLIQISYILKFSLDIERSNKRLSLDFPVIISTTPQIYSNAPIPKLYYEHSVTHVEGGNYIPPEFLVGQVYDGGASNIFQDGSKYGSQKSNLNMTPESLLKDSLETLTLINRNAYKTSPQTSLDESRTLYKPVYVTLTCPSAIVTKSEAKQMFNKELGSTISMLRNGGSDHHLEVTNIPEIQKKKNSGLLTNGALYDQI
ncbi:unnamed protein product [Gordionus sp. m RMFG-2023]|uniref:arrestin domain-containing protein 17-like n=1 Tax=Gordionus sp. m RMFG-2023 TaxID=3053472 RepID=UPI0030E1D4FA